MQNLGWKTWKVMKKFGVDWIHVVQGQAHVAMLMNLHALLKD
jgi:hypothetical protein